MGASPFQIIVKCSRRRPADWHQPLLGTFAEDADGNRYYTDKKGNITYNVDSYNYVDSNGEIITDGYGYIDPYTGAYIQ